MNKDNLERDKFLTEAMGECWHDVKRAQGVAGFCYNCVICRAQDVWNNDFSTWPGFGKLWEWAQKQEWWFLLNYDDRTDHKTVDMELIHPDRFADAVYSFLKERR